MGPNKKTSKLMKLQNPIDVNITDKTISVLLAGGLGNMMFQTATLMVYAKEMGYDPIVGYWTTHQSESSKFNKHLNRNGRNIHFDPWGGHILKDPHISFGDVYPNLPWFDSRPNAFEWWFDQSLGWDIDTGEGGVYYDLKQKVKPPYLFQGYFFNKLYWHHERDYILEIFEPDENISNYIEYNYGGLFKNSISLHLRMGGGRQDNFFDIKLIPEEWVIKILNNESEGHKVLVFSDNLESAKNFVNKLGFPKEKFVYIDEDPYIAVHMMSMCDKHILSNSTLSFWGAYLDKKQENEYTFIHESFFKRHPYSMIPYNKWKIND